MKLLIHENACEYIVCEMTAISSRGDELYSGGGAIYKGSQYNGRLTIHVLVLFT